ncbi:MAG: hypothetical protein O3A82_07830 [Verrucomicrobia bacterium]|nr:hypothetical protein [Verrucomicrobiota bacterium]
MNPNHQQSEGEKSLREVQSMSDGFLLEWIAGKRSECLDVFVGKYEIERRKNKWQEIRSWITISLSVLALCVSIVALIKK